MKNETARREIESLDYYLQNHTDDYSEESHTAMMMAVKALEQEPCKDAISREDALMCLTGEIKETDTIETIIARIVRRIRKLPPVTPQPKWIPVNEELPEEGKEVLTCSNGGFIEIQSLEDSCADIYWENCNGDWSDIDEVIAWMPLPTPYDSQERNDKE